MEKLFSSVADNKNKLNSEYEKCSDFLLRECEVCERSCIVCVLDGMIDSLQLSQMIMRPILNSTDRYKTPGELFSAMSDKLLGALEMNVVDNFEDIYTFLSSGFAIVIVDGVSKAYAIGIQGFEKRGVTESSNESNIKAPKECFTETLNDNKAMLHRRIKSPKLKLEQLNIGSETVTPLIIVYIDGVADERLISEVKSRILRAPIRQLMDYGELVPFLNSNVKSYFTAVGNTERPDTLCSKLYEGRIGVIVDGSPFAMYVPCLFTDSFSTVDDYDNRPFYATLNRILKYFSFVISVFLPSFYVATGTYHQELIPASLMYTIAAAEATTPFSLMQEALMILVLYEIMKEAGLRLPKAIGHAVSIIGALVIGDAVVNAGIIGAPMLVVVAVTAISSYVIYPLYESIAVLRLIFILLGGFLGIYGLVLGICVLCVNITALNPYGVPFSAPISPFDKRSMSDVFYRRTWKKLAKRKVRIQNLRGADVNDV